MAISKLSKFKLQSRQNIIRQATSTVYSMNR